MKIKSLSQNKKLPGKYGLIGKSPQLRELFKKIERLAENDATILITGPTGCGKELAAQAVHQQSSRKNKPFITVNCGSIPSELFESELFGHEKGSFTSALESKPGKFELAQGGTLFLDEIGNLPLSLQAKLLRVLQEKEIERVGGLQTLPVDVRIITATNADLKKEISNGNFRLDLYHRLNVVPLYMPALSSHQEDIEYLISFFLDQFNIKYKNNFKAIDLEALATLKKYTWSGNIRELKHLLERIAALESGPVLKYEYLPLEFHALQHAEYKTGTFKDLLENFARNIIADALNSYHGNHSRTARFLGLKRTTLLSKIKQYKLEASYSH